MSDYRESYNGVPDGDFPLIPIGRYLVRVTNAAIKPAKTSGQETWCLDLEIIDGEYKGRKLWLYHGMSDEARSMRKGTIRSLGFDTDTEVDLIDDVLGKKAIAEVYHDEYKGETREKVKRLRSRIEPPKDDFDSGRVLGKEDSPF